jgi:hypothetical protein
MILGFIAITYLIESNEANGWAALFICVVIGAVLYFFGAKDFIVKMWDYVAANPMLIIGFILGYFVIGTLWSLTKWYFFLKRRQKKSNWPTKRVEEKMSKDSFQPVPYKIVSMPLRAQDHRSTIMMWMTWWPFSALWTIVDDPVRKAFSWIFDHIEATFDRVAQRVFDGTEKKNENE